MSAAGWGLSLSLLTLAAIRRPGRTSLPAVTLPPVRRAAGGPAAVAGAARRAWEHVSGRHVDRRDEQLCTALDHVAASLRAGSTLVAAISGAAEATADPVGAELRLVAASVRSGAPLRVSLHQWAGRSAAHSGTQLATNSLLLAASAGGEVARSVDRVAATIRERREVRAEARALATQARASAAVLTVAPLVFTALVATVEPGVVAFLVGTPAGLVCLMLGLALDAAGALWMTRIVRSPA